MKRFYFFAFFFLISSVGTMLFSQSRTVINTSTIGRSVITMDTTSNSGGDIWKQLEQERIVAEKAEQERIAAEKKAEEERIAAEKAEQERLALEKKAEQERIAAEKAEQERLAAERKAEQERLALEKKAEQERLAAERKAEQERLASEKKLEQERIAAEKAEQQRIADSIAIVQRLEKEALRIYHRDSIRSARKERIAAYPWTNMILLNVAYALYPEYAFGITYARVKKWGYYVNIMLNPSIRFNANYDADSQGSISGVTPFYSGIKATTRWSGTVGCLVRIRIPLYAYAGIGYGFRGVFYETSDKEWVAWHTQNTIYNGMHWEAGLVGNIKGFGISLGISSITDFSNIYYEGKIGLGYCF